MRIFTVLVLAMCGFAAAAHADYFKWQDAQSGVSVTYPDTWRMVQNKQPDDVLTIMAPSDRAHAACRVRVRDDMRYAIFPPRDYKAIQKTAYSSAFWNKYLQEYSNAELHDETDSAGLGLGWGSTVEAGYWSANPGPMMQREALLFGSMYDGHLYILECSAQAQTYPDWKKAFLGIASSVDFVKIYDTLLTGYYRPFTQDERQRFQNPDDKTLSYY